MFTLIGVVGLSLRSGHGGFKSTDAWFGDDLTDGTLFTLVGVATFNSLSSWCIFGFSFRSTTGASVCCNSYNFYAISSIKINISYIKTRKLKYSPCHRNHNERHFLQPLLGRHLCKSAVSSALWMSWIPLLLQFSYLIYLHLIQASMHLLFHLHPNPSNSHSCLLLYALCRVIDANVEYHNFRQRTGKFTKKKIDKYRIHCCYIRIFIINWWHYFELAKIYML